MSECKVIPPYRPRKRLGMPTFGVGLNNTRGHHFEFGRLMFLRPSQYKVRAPLAYSWVLICLR
jgi:hypothetical protein